MSEEIILLRALRDMNLPKFIKQDASLFRLLLGDLFPGVELPVTEYGALHMAIERELERAGLQKHPAVVFKAVQLFESKATRHCNMLVGTTLSGKSTAWRTLAKAKTSLAREEGLEGFVPVRPYVINPKSISMNELYGAYDLATMEWTDGILSSVFRNCAQDEKLDEKWVVLDGPVDTLWIESMNTVMDDNKVLTLINGDRISMTNTMSLVFEVRDLAVASPATVSRAGMVYVDAEELGWRPYVTSWLARRFQNPGRRAVFQALFDRYVDPLLLYKRTTAKELIPITDFNAVITLCNLWDSLILAGGGPRVLKRDDSGDLLADDGRLNLGRLWAAEDASVELAEEELDAFNEVAERWFCFTVQWTLGGAVDDMGRKYIDNFLRDLEPSLPPGQTSYEYFVDPKTQKWRLWSDKVSASWKPPRDMPFHRITVPTIDTVRYTFLLNGLLAAKVHTLVVGSTGTAKTMLVSAALDALPDTHSKLVLNFSSATSSAAVQGIIEGAMEKRSKDKLGPSGGKKLVTFVDDLNMPKKDEFGSQPPLELLRQWVDYGCWYDRAKQSLKYILDMQLVAAMGPPGGGRSVITERLQSRFALLNFTFPADAQLKRIFERMLVPMLSEFDDEIKPLGQPLVGSTIELYKQMAELFLPTPSKCHYLFNLRDIAKVVRGLMLADKRYFDTRDSMLRLWVHESYRVFGDRLTNAPDCTKFRDVLGSLLDSCFDTSWAKLMSSLEEPDEGPLFVDFLSEPVGDRAPPYEEVLDRAKLKQLLEERLEDYNMEPGLVAMDLVLFKDAIGHVLRIHRVLRSPRGNAMLVGVGGSGRQSLTRLAAYIAEYKVFQIEITKSYRASDFREDLKALYEQAGAQNLPTVFLFNDSQLKEESFLEDINNILSSGEVPQLYLKDELAPIYDAMRPVAKAEGVLETADNLWQLFIGRVRSNLHVVLAMSPVGDAFRNRCRMYPALVNSTTIDWFMEWPVAALREVAGKFLQDAALLTPEEAKAEESKAAERAAARAEGGGAGGRGGRGGRPGGLAGLGGGGRGGGRGGRSPEADESAAEAPTATEIMARKVAGVFALAHDSVVTASARMAVELKRVNYVTPTNYLELVKGYRELLTEKRREIGEAASRLKNGLSKLDESKVQVEEMQVQLASKKEDVAQKQKDCEELLVVIVSERRQADEQRKQVEAEGERIGKEEEECQAMAASAEADLEEALPALQRAMAEVDKLDKSSITEVKSYLKPPAAVQMVLSAVMILFGENTDWVTARKKISEVNFLQQVKNFAKDSITNSTLAKIKRYTSKDGFSGEEVGRVSRAAGALCIWVCAMETYATVFRQVAPKRAALGAAMQKLSAAQAALSEAQAKLQEVTDKVNALKKQYDDSVEEKNSLRKEAEDLELKLARAEKLVTGLGGERSRWESSITELDGAMSALVGDCLVAAGFLSYAGPFDSAYRSSLVGGWMAAVAKAAIPCSPDFSFAAFLADPTDVRDWNIQGLPKDDFSTENGVIVKRGRRWPLMIDPQGQANRWIKAMEGDELRIIDLKQKDFLRTVENAIQFGQAVLLQEVEEDLDPSLEPVLTKSLIKQGGRLVIRLGDKELDYSSDFRFYITTKLPNPHYAPEVSTKTTIVNFVVREAGLEAQLLGIVVQKEEPKLEAQKSELVLRMASEKRKLSELESEILRLLSSATGSLLEDEELVNALQSSKVISEEVIKQLVVSEETERKIDELRNSYRPVSRRASILFFVLNDMSRVDPMYQFSLDAYTDLFNRSITGSKDKSGASLELADRIVAINDYHTYEVYATTCRGLFEKHKLLFAFQMCIKRLQSEGRVQKEEYDFFLRGGQVMDRSEQRMNPTDWLDEAAWDNVTELDKVASFKGICGAFEQNPRDWKAWYFSAAPEGEPLPGEWSNKCSDLQRMVLLRSLRPDRVLMAAREFVSSNLGPRFVEPPPLVLRDIWASSTERTPLIFVLSPGVDPTKQLITLAEDVGVKVETISLGQGQAPIATEMLERGLAEGNWIFLANCHLSLSWMPQLEKIVENYVVSDSAHPRFRLWLSSNPHPRFPISILQRGIKITTEPPRGVRANLLRLYGLITEEQFERCTKKNEYKKLLFCLCWFHSLLVERRKFKSLGWNIPYDFNESDFSICENLLALYLEEYPEAVPWDALRYLIAEANYGGRVTDDWDRRLVRVYINQFFCEEAVTVPNFGLCAPDESGSTPYYVPDVGELKGYRDYVRNLPAVEHPAAFGQHGNAEIASQIADTGEMLDTILSLQPRIVTEGGESNDSKVLRVAKNLAAQVPERFDVLEARSMLEGRPDPEPLKVVLLQELERYNSLLAAIESSLSDLMRGIQGLVVITPELESVFDALLVGKVPTSWSFAYPSLKPLGSWIRDLQLRCEQARVWLEDALPKVFWLSGFTYPTGFLTALLQTSARKNGVPIDSLSWEFLIMQQDEIAITQHPKEGTYVKGLFLEGARWDYEHAHLAEPEPMELFSPMPIIHFKPVDSRKKVSKGFYTCPLYLYPVRTGTRERPSFTIAVELKCGSLPPSGWALRGCALLCSLAV
eukprot:PLAT3317.25.p1 GENE.PLAT3317.25~~PLAT3317.25.p1  ORF type:complete len:2725 (+),score=1732.12 PLAT3317.25:536-8176(+)